MEFETPAQLLARLRLGREEFCQRLLTSLILHGPYPKWNSRSTAGPAGLSFLRQLHELSFGSPWPGDGLVFVDEFELPPRHDTKQGGSPDYGLLWGGHVWMIELKTEKGSHRRGQLPAYFDLAHHHYPDAQVDLTYLTPPMTASLDPPGAWARYSHITWDAVVPLVRSVWPSGTAPGQQEVIEGLIDLLSRLDEPASQWRASVAPVTAPVPPAVERDPVAEGLQLAEETATDGEQRGLDFLPADLEDLMGVRLQIRDALAAAPAGSPMRHVMPWLWRPESGGAPMTAAGRENGMELRLSRYESPLY